MIARRLTGPASGAPARCVGRAVVAALVLLAAGAPARAHDMWIRPTTFAPAVDQTIAVALAIGHAGDAESFPRRLDHLARFEALHAERAAPLPGQPGFGPAGYFKAAAPGLHVLVYESRGSFSELPPDRFDGYLAEEGLETVRAWRRTHGEDDRPGRERYTRSLKSLVPVGMPTGAWLDRAVGLPLELVVEGALDRRDDETLSVRLLWQGRPLSGALVDLQALDLGREGDVQSKRTDADGRVSFDRVGGGAWLLAAVHMVRATDDETADWRSVFASATMALPPPVPTVAR